MTGGFNTCSSCEEQLDATLPFERMQMFQYMLLLRGATVVAVGVPSEPQSFNTCSSCEEQLHAPRALLLRNVSIHAPLARSNKTR